MSPASRGSTPAEVAAVTAAAPLLADGLRRAVVHGALGADRDTARRRA